MKSFTLIMLYFSFILTSCGQSPESSTETQQTAESTTGGIQPAASHAGGKTAGYGSLTATLPDGWIEQPPASQMRLGNYTLPKQGNDTEDAELVVSFFGNSPGMSDVQANLQRWAGQFVQPDGSSSQSKLQSHTMTVNGMNVTIAELTGTFMKSKTPGMMSGPTVETSGYRLLAAIMETKDGPYFFKITGPENTVNYWKDSFHTYIQSIR